MTVCDKPGDLPRIRTENFPVFAVLLAERVSVLVSMVLLGLNDAVTPLGKPDAVMLTLESKPFSGVTVIVDMTLLSCARLNELGDADSVKFGRGVTVRDTVMVCDKLPDIPVMVTVTVPGAAASVAVSVSVSPTVTGFDDTPSDVVLAIRFTVTATAGELLAAKLVSPL